MIGKKSFVAASLAYVVLGLVLLLFPDLTTSLICTAVGLLLLAYGVSAGLSFFAGSGGGYRSQLDMVLGGFAAILGVLFLLKPHTLLSVLPIIFGLYILIDGFLNLKRGLDMRSYGYAGWTTTLVLSVVSVVLGAVILWNPFSTHLLLVRIIGASFLYEGTADLWATHTLDKLIRGK
jgi:uncharacterized membrane protein HdeD (DUF308 family)